MRFADIPGLTNIKQQLIHSVTTGKVPHAQLFEGTEGTLNLPLALAFATYLHCEKRTKTDACGECSACSKSLKYIHPDTHYVFPLGNIRGDKDEDRFKAEMLKTWRAFLLEQPFGNLGDWVNYYGGEDKQVNISRDESREIIRSLSLKPFESRFKIMIIWQPEFMHPSAANGILKILEEPPAFTLFFLVTNQAKQLLPTIVSRTQNVHVPLLDDDDMEKYLAAHANLSGARLSKVVQLAEGNLNFALALTESEEDNNQEVFSDWMRACVKPNFQRLVELSESFHELDRLSQRNLLRYSQNMLREALLQLAGAESISRAKGDELEFIRKFSAVMNVSRIEKASQWINDSELFLERNGSAKMIFLDLSLQIAGIIKK